MDKIIRLAFDSLCKSEAMANAGLISAKELKKDINKVRKQLGYEPLKKIKLLRKYPIND